MRTKTLKLINNKENILFKYDNNISAIILAKEYGVCYPTMLTFIKQCGRTVKKKSFVRYTEEEKRIIKDNYSEIGAIGLSKIIPYSLSSISSVARRMGLRVKDDFLSLHRRNKEDLSRFIDIKEPFIAYLLGFWWADATIAKKTNNIRFKIVEEDFIDIKEDYLKTGNWKYCIRHDGKANHKHQAVLEINNYELHQFLKQCDFQIKSGASADKILSYIPEPLKHYWFRGFFDGDGSFIWGKNGYDRKISITSCFKQNWSFLYKLCESLNMGYSYSKVINTDMAKSSKVSFCNENWIRKFCNYIYQGELFGLKRKHQKWLDYIEYKKIARPNKTSRFRGVSFDKRRNVFVLQIYLNKKVYHETFIKEEDAAMKYNELALQKWGNKAVLNII